MSNSDYLKNVPNVNSEEFDKFIKDMGLDNRNDKYIYSTSTNFTKDSNKVNNDDTNTDATAYFDDHRSKHPQLSFALILVGSSIVMFKLLSAFYANVIFKGNLKTIQYLTKL